MLRNIELTFWIIFTVVLFFWGVGSLDQFDYAENTTDTEQSAEITDYIDLDDFGKKCKDGDSAACTTLKKQLNYSTEQCKKESRQGCFYLAYQLDMGYGLDEDNKSAIKYYEKGCSLDSSSSCYNLGIMYEGGEGTEANPAKAKEYYKKACDLNNESACKALKKK